MLGWFKRKHTVLAAEEIEPEWISDDTAPFYRYFNELTGIYFDQKDETTTSKLVRFAKKHRCYSFSHLLARLKSDSILSQNLVNFLTVNETYFFREMEQIRYMVMEIQKTSAQVRILCAPGSTGEEPYTIAIALSEAGVDMRRITIVSVDINTEVIHYGQEALYTKRSLHRVDQMITQRYFNEEEDRYRLKEVIREKVMFQNINLFELRLFELGEFDYIFSRNMLIYFDPHKTALAIKRLSSMARNSSSVLFFGHADIITPPEAIVEHYVEGVKFYTHTQ
jgi:chemotaxis protein methyltransferase CheR